MLYTQFGTTGGDFASDSAGFEEWKVKQYPYVAVTKTATTSLTRTYDWTISKSVTPATWDLFTGDSGTSAYTVAVDKTGSSDSGWAVSGTITIENTSEADAVIDSVTDVISGVGTVVASCGVTFPYTLDEGDDLSCTYSSPLPDGTSRTNTATVELDYGGLFTATAPVSFASPTITEVNGTVNVSDTVQGALGSASDDKTWNYDRTFTCNGDAGKHDNTATITQTGQTASASVTVACHEIAVTKTATTSLTRTYDWTISKSVTPATWDLFTGDSGTSAYTVAVDKTGSSDAGWAVSGTITVSNVGNPIAARINSVSDVISPAIAASVSCGVTFPYTLAAGGTLNCTYSAALPDGTSRTNTATAVRQNYSYASNGTPTATGTTSKTGTAPVSFSSPTITEVNGTIDVTDSYAGALGSASDDTSWDYDRTFTCDGDKGGHDNTATITQTGQTASASVTVACHEITVTKTATPTYTRMYHWKITKSSGDPNGQVLVLNPGEIYANYPYSVTVNLDSPAYTDSAWAVSGNIAVSNVGNPIAAKINSVSDVISGIGSVSISCGVTFPYTLAAGGTLNCTYSSALPDATSRTNTATAVRQNYD